MLVVKSHGDVFDVESQYSDEVTEMATVTFAQLRNNSNDGSTAAVEKALGVSGLGLGGERIVTKAFRAEALKQLPVGKVLNLHINREWCDVNPYPKAVNDKGKPLAKPIPGIMCPDGIARDLYSRTFISETELPDTFNIINDEPDVMNAPPFEEVEAPATGRRTRTRK